MVVVYFIMKLSIVKGTLSIFLFAALNFLGLAGMVWYANARESVQSLQKSDLCPSPTAEFAERKKTPMSAITHNAALPRIDAVIPSKIETATFGLG